LYRDDAVLAWPYNPTLDTLQQQHYHSQLLLYSIWAQKIISGKIFSMLKSECIIGREDL
jgi:hypothetical protein